MIHAMTEMDVCDRDFTGPRRMTVIGCVCHVCGAYKQFPLFTVRKDRTPACNGRDQKAIDLSRFMAMVRDTTILEPRRAA